MRRPTVAALAASLLLSCSREDPARPLTGSAEVESSVRRLSGSASERNLAEARLSRTERRLTWGALGQVVGDASAPAEARAAAVRVFARTADWEGLPGVALAVADDPDPAVRRAALDAVVEFANPDHRAFLLSRAAEQPEPARRDELLAAAAAVAARERMWQLRRIAQLKDPVERALAVRRLGEIGGEEDVRVLLAIYGAPGADAFLKQEIILAVAALGGAEAKAFVRGRLASGIPHERTLGAQGETLLKDPEALGRLAELLGSDPLPDTRIAAARALAAIGGDEARAAIDRGCRQLPPDAGVKLTAACRELLASR